MNNPTNSFTVVEERGREKDNGIDISADGTSSVSIGDEIILIPQPSDDPRDPLNWPLRKKAVIGVVLGFSLFIGFSAPFNGQIQIAQQAALYHKSTVQITYFVSR
jgi:hypothetical protein